MNKPISSAMLSCSGTILTSDEKRLFAEHNPLGITLFNRNIADKNQLKALIKDIKETIARPDVLIAIDQEGGRVRRLFEPQFRSYIAQKQIGEIALEQGLEKAKQIAHAHATLITQDLAELGINWNYAPVIDICHPDTSPVLASRCFSDHPQIVTSLGKEMIEAYLSNAICPCIKHLPALGPATLDPHLELPKITSSLAELAADFAPMQALAPISPAAMTAHILLTAVDDKLPATQSPKVVSQIIRGLLGFQGFLITDAIDMNALHGSLALKTQLSLDAGCDAICYCHGTFAGLTEVCKNSRPLSDAAQRRFAPISKLIQEPHKSVDIQKISKDYLQFSANLKNYDENYDATEVLHLMTSNQ